MEREEVPQAQPLLVKNQRLALILYNLLCRVVLDATDFEQRMLRKWISVYYIAKFLQPLDFGGLHDIDELAVKKYGWT